MRNLQEIKEVINSNRENGRNQYEGLDSSEIGRYNQSMMWGDNWESFDEDVYDAYTR